MKLPTTAQEEGVENSGPQSTATRQRRRTSPTPPATTSLMATQPEPQQPRSRSTTGDPKRAGLTTGEDEIKPPPEQEETKEEPEVVVAAAAAAASPPAPAEHASSDASSAASSPLRWPSLPRAVVGRTDTGQPIFEPLSNIDPATDSAYDKLRRDYFAKHARQQKLVSLNSNIPDSCLTDPALSHLRRSATNTILRTARSVLPLSSYIGGAPLRQCSGFLIDWDAESKTATVLTSALLIRSKSPAIDDWLGGDEYASDAKVCVHLTDKADTTVDAALLYCDEHFNLALFNIPVDVGASAEIPTITGDVKYGQEIFVLGRNGDRDLRIHHGSVVFEGPSTLHRHHYMFTSCSIDELCIGGPAIDLDGQIVGMVSLPEMAFTPSVIILKCLHMWKKFGCVPRMHLGMKFDAIALLDPVRIERISRRCDVDDGLIVTQVSTGSAAEKAGVRNGDIVRSLNGENMSTTIELEKFLLDMCEEHLDNGNSFGSSVELTVRIFYMRNHSYGTIRLTANVSRDVEVIKEDTYTVTPAHCTLVSAEDVVQDS